MKHLIKNTYYTVMANPAYLKAAFGMFFVCILVLSSVSPIHAAKDFAEMGKNLEEQSQGIAGAAQMLFYLLGFILVGTGLLMLALSRSRGAAVAMLCVGFGLTSIGFFISMGSSSFFGSDVNQVDTLFN